MKKFIIYILFMGIFIVFTPDIHGQTDTLIKPGRPRTFTDPKITPENDKVLLDTSSNVVDSLLDSKKTGRKPMERSPENH